MGPNGEGLLQHFRRCTNWMHRVHNRLEGGECGGLHHGQGKLLATLLQQDGCSQRELCGLLQIRPASLSELLDKLERSGAVERRQSPDDRRVSCVYLTDLGRERAALAAVVTAGERRFTALAVAAGDRPVTPCGICRQMLAEFGDLTVIASGAEGEDTLIAPLSALLPHAFTGFSPDPVKR